MSRNVDWSETDRLVERLRAKLAEDPDFVNDPEKVAALNADSAAPTAPKTEQTAPAPKATSKKAARRGAAQKKTAETAPAKAAPVEQPAVKSAPKADLPPKQQEPPKAAPAKATQPAAEQGTEPTPPTAAAPAASGTARRKVYRPGTVSAESRNNMFASAYRRDEDDYVARPVLSGKKTPTRTAEPTALPNAEEIGAGATVENLLHDLFGTAGDWLTDKEPPKQGEQKGKKPAEKPVAQVIHKPEPPKPTATEAVPVETTAAKEPVPVATKAEKCRPTKKAPAVATHPEPAPETVTREQDGQMALALPGATAPEKAPAKGERAVHHKSLEERVNLTDDGQINLFSIFSADGRKSRERSEREAAEMALRDRERMEFKRSVESSDEDFRLLMGLDYENELGNAIGFEKIREFHEAGTRVKEQPKRRRNASGKVEFESLTQAPALRRGYTRQKRGHVVRLIVSLVLTLIICRYEGTNAFGAMFGGPFDGTVYPVSYILLGIQLLVLVAFFSRQRLIEGLSRLVHFSPIDYSLCEVMLIATLVYHVVLLFLPHTGRPALYLSPAAVSILLLALADLFNWWRESMAFVVVSSAKQKYALIPRVSVGGREGNALVDLEEGGESNSLWYAHSVGFVRNYMANTEKRLAHSRTLGAQLLLIFSVGCAVGLFVGASGGGFAEVLRTVFVTVLLCAPTASLLVTAMPMFLGACLRLRKRSAIIGETPVYTCAGPTTLVLPDTEIFAHMQHERFELVENCDPHRVTVLVRALLDRLKSPLAESVSVERDLRMSPDRIQLIEIAEHGVSAVTDDGVKLLMGNMEYMQKYGIQVRPRTGGDYDDIARRLICVAVDHKVSALFLARYRLNDNAAELLRELEEAEVQVTVRTADPGVQSDLLARLLPDRREPVRVMKPTAREIDLSTESVDATIVSLGSCREVARTFITCRRIRRARAFGRLCQALSVGFGAMIAGLCTLLSGMVAVPSILVTLYLLFWCGVHAVTSILYLREKTDE